MGKIAIVFGGQGSQYPGMGKELYHRFPQIRDIYDQLGEELQEISFYGPVDQLSQTKNLQAIMLAFQLSALRLLQEKNLDFQATCGLSLGEYASLVACGLLPEEQALDLVQRRAYWMDREARKMDSRMLAVLNMKEEDLVAILARGQLQGRVYLANKNSSRQLVLAGEAQAVEEISQEIQDLGYASRILEVTGAFHTPFMAGAQPGFRQDLEKINFQRAKKDYYPNLTGQKYQGQDPVALLADHLVSPVLLFESLGQMVADGVDHFIEIGPGQVLSKIIGREFKGLKRETLTQDQDLITYIERTGNEEK